MTMKKQTITEADEKEGVVKQEMIGSTIKTNDAEWKIAVTYMR